MRLVGTFCISGISTAYAEENDDESVSSEVNSAKEQMEEEEGLWMLIGAVIIRLIPSM